MVKTNHFEVFLSRENFEQVEFYILLLFIRLAYFLKSLPYLTSVKQNSNWQNNIDNISDNMVCAPLQY